MTSETVGVDKREWGIAAALFALTSAIRLAFVMWMANGSVLAALRKQDGAIYEEIARFGYFSANGTGPADPSVYEKRLAFFPGFPALIRALTQVTGMNATAAGLVVASIAGVSMTAGMMALAGTLGAGRTGRIAAAILLLGAPMSLTFNMVYTEAPFLALSLWGLVAMVRRRWLLAAGFVFLAGFFRLTAVDLWLALLLVIAVYARREWRAWLAAVLAAAPLVGFIAYASSFTRDVGGYFGLQTKGWHSTFDFGRATVRWIAAQLPDTHEFGYLLSIGVIFAAVASCFFAFRRLPWAIWLFGAGVVANVVLSDGIMHSRPRLLLPAIVLLIPLALRIAGGTGRGERIALGLGWVVFGAWASAHMVLVFQWAI